MTSRHPPAGDDPRDRGRQTRERILDVAERLFAERGIANVSSRQIAIAARQRNNYVVGHHFGGKPGLVRAIQDRHAVEVERGRKAMVAELRSDAPLRAWMSCLVRPVTEHLNALEPPTCYARFLAQAMNEPSLREVVVEDTVSMPSIPVVLERMTAVGPRLPTVVRAERCELVWKLIVHACADRERAVCEGAMVTRATWIGAAEGLTDALVGLWTAPVTVSIQPAGTLAEYSADTAY